MEDLSDPFGDRVMKNVPPLARFPLTRDELWHESSEYPTNEALPPGNWNSIVVEEIVVLIYRRSINLKMAEVAL